MAIPNSPEWAQEDVEPIPYINYGVVEPQPITGISTQSAKIGPLVLGDSQGDIAKRFWLVTYESPNVFIRGSNGGYWGAKELLFQELEFIKQVDLTYDQLGRPIVIYLTNDGDVKLYWYDPVAADQVVTTISTGSSVAAGFDIKKNTSDPNSDAMITYVRDNFLYWRLQRDRWAIEYDPNITHKDLKVLSMGMTNQNTFQIEYDFAE